MNAIVQSWNKHLAKPRYAGADTVDVGDGVVVLQNEVLKPEVKKMGHPDRKVVINEGAVKELAMHGPQDRAEALYRETARTLDRLGLKVGKKQAGFTRVGRFEGGRPCLHDVVLWLNDLEVTPKYKKDLVFLKKLHATVRGRAYEETIAEVEG